MPSLFTSESVTEGHPDKVADQISDAILDAILAKDPLARVACEAIVTTGLVIVVGARSADDGLMRFNPRLPNDTATLLLVSVFIIVIAGLTVGSSHKVASHIQTISAIGAG